MELMAAAGRGGAWTTKRVDEMGEVLAGKALDPGGPGSLRPYLRTKNVLDGRIALDDLLEMPMTGKEFERFRVMEGDVLLNEGQSLDLVGRCSMYRGELGMPCAMQNQLVRFRAGRQTSPEFAEQLFRYCQQSGVFAAIATQTTSVAHLGSARFSSLRLPWPSDLAEQEAIAAALSSVDLLGRGVEKLIAKKRDIKQAAMQQLLTGQTRLPGFTGKWQPKFLGELFLFSGGLPAPRAQLSASGHCYLHYGDIHKSSKTYIDVESESLDIPRLDVPLSSVSASALLADGDVVFVDASEDDTGASKHVVVLNPGSRPFVSGLHTIVAKSRSAELDTGFKRYCFQNEAVKRQFRFFAAGTKVKGISKTSIAKISLEVPTVEEQASIAAVLSDIDAELMALEARLAKTRDLKQGMMQELLTGRIRLV